MERNQIQCERFIELVRKTRQQQKAFRINRNVEHLDKAKWLSSYIDDFLNGHDLDENLKPIKPIEYKQGDFLIDPDGGENGQ